MKCDCTEKVSLLIDGELPENEAREVQRHLLQCVYCQQAQADFLSFRSQIGAYIPQLEAVSQRVALNRILNVPEKGRAVRSARKTWTWRFSPQVAAFATMILLVAAIGLVVYQSVNRQESNYAQVQSPKQTPAEQPPVESKPADQQGSATTPIQTTTPAGTTTPSPSTTPVPAATPKVPLRPRRATPPDPPPFALDGSRSANTVVAANLRSGDTQTLTAMHLEKSELLLRAFRNVRLDKSGSAEVDYERKQAKQLVLQNMMLRREADSAGDVQIAGLLENLEPILLDIANLPRKPAPDDIEVIKERVERKNIVALLQINSSVLARALD